MTKYLLPSLLALSLLACDSNDGGSSTTTVSLVGKSTEAQVESAVTAVCTYSATCGEIDISCSSDMEGAMTCEGELVTVDFDTCKEDQGEEVEAVLGGCDFTTDELRKIETCLNAMLAVPCVTEAELADYIDALNRGEEPELGEEPEACADMEDIIEGCPPRDGAGD